MITRKCPHCQTGIRGEDRIAGRVVTCPKCKNQMQMPAAPQPNVGANIGAQNPRTPSAPSPRQSPVSQPNVQAVVNKPAATDSGDGMSRQVRIAMIAIPVVTVLAAVIFILIYERSRQEAHRQEAQAAAQKIFDEAQQALKQNNISEAAQKLKAYLSDENAQKKIEAKKLLAEIELSTSANLASDTLDKMGDEDFKRFQQTKHLDDARVTQPALAKMWNSTLLQALPEAARKREDAKAKHNTELAEHKKRQPAEAAKIAESKKTPEERHREQMEAEREEASKKVAASLAEIEAAIQKAEMLEAPARQLNHPFTMDEPFVRRLWELVNNEFAFRKAQKTVFRSTFSTLNVRNSNRFGNLATNAIMTPGTYDFNEQRNSLLFFLWDRTKRG